MKLKQLHDRCAKESGFAKECAEVYFETELVRSAPAIIELYEAAKYNYESRDDPRRDLRLEAAPQSLGAIAMTEAMEIVCYLIGMATGWWVGRYGYLFFGDSWMSRKPKE